MLFMVKSRKIQILIATINGKLILLERKPGLLNDIYNTDGYIYELDGSTFNHYDYLWGQEVISFGESIKPLNKTQCKNILEEITEEEKKGNIRIYRYPNRPKSIPLDNSDLIEKYINFEKSGLTGAIDDLLEVYPEFSEMVKQKLNKK